MSLSYPNLNLLLQAANRRQLFLSLARAFFRATLMIVVAMIVAVIVDAVFELPAWALMTIDVALVTCLLLASARIVKVVRLATFDSRRLARLLEDRLGITNSALINAVDLREQPHRSASQRLTNASVSLGEQAARKLDVAQALSGRSVQRAFIGACVAVGVAALSFLMVPSLFTRGLPRFFDPRGNHPPFTLVSFDVRIEPNPLRYGSTATVTANLAGWAQTDRADLVTSDETDVQRLPMIATDEGFQLRMDHVQKTRAFYIDTPRGRSDWYRMEVPQVPMFEEVWVSYEYPAYTDWAPRRHRLYGRDIEGIEGTEVTLEASSLFPLAAGLATLERESSSRDAARRRFELFPDQGDPRRVVGRFILEHSGRLSLRLLGQNQQTGPEIRDARVTCRADRRPSVSIVDPEPVALAVEDWQIPVAVQATDDIQVSAAQLRIRKNDESPVDLALAREPGGGGHWYGRADFNLTGAQAKAGDRFRFVASATDNRAGQNQSSDSSEHVVQVISHEEYFDYLRTLYRTEQLSQEIVALNGRLQDASDVRDDVIAQANELRQSLAERQPLTEQQDRQLDDLQQTLQRQSQQSAEIEEQVDERLDAPQLYDMEREYRDQLRHLSDQLGQQQENVDRLQDSLQAMADDERPSADHLQQLNNALTQYEQQAEPFGDDTQSELQETEQQARALTDAQRMLTSTERIKSVEDQQRRLAERFDQVGTSDASSTTRREEMDQLSRDQDRQYQELNDAQSSLRAAADRVAQELPHASADAYRLCDSIDQLGVKADQLRAASAGRQGAAAEASYAASRAADKLQSLTVEAPSTDRVAQEFSERTPIGKSGVSNGKMRESLKQLMQTPSLPGVGMNSENASQKGLASRYGLHGPRPVMDAFQGSRGRRSSHGRTKGFDEVIGDDVVSAESIEARSRTAETVGAASLRGVPIGYREQAEAYFRRLAEESMIHHDNHSGRQ